MRGFAAVVGVFVLRCETVVFLVLLTVFGTVGGVVQTVTRVQIRAAVVARVEAVAVVAEAAGVLGVCADGWSED